MTVAGETSAVPNNSHTGTFILEMATGGAQIVIAMDYSLPTVSIPQRAITHI